MTAYGMRSSYWSSDVCSSDRVAYADKAAEHYAYTPAAKGRRRLRNVALDYIAAADPQAGAALAFAQFEGTDNMTDRQAALTTLASGISDARVAALDIFYNRYSDNALVLDKWFSTQALSTRDDTAQMVEELAHQDRKSTRLNSSH